MFVVVWITILIDFSRSILGGHESLTQIKIAAGESGSFPRWSSVPIVFVCFLFQSRLEMQIGFKAGAVYKAALAVFFCSKILFVVICSWPVNCRSAGSFFCQSPVCQSKIAFETCLCRFFSSCASFICYRGHRFVLCNSHHKQMLMKRKIHFQLSISSENSLSAKSSLAFDVWKSQKLKTFAQRCPAMHFVGRKCYCFYMVSKERGNFHVGGRKEFN